MLETAFHTYQRKKVINVNVNVALAGLLAIALAKLPVAWVSEWIGPEHRIAIVIITALIDGVADFIIYFVLHWLANHWKPFKPRTEAEKAHHAKKDNFFRDASVIQFQRYMLSPIFYVIAVGGHWALMEFAGVRHSWAFVFAYTVAILVTRIIHTIWGLRSGTLR
jgi:hypothetical protein